MPPHPVRPLPGRESTLPFGTREVPRQSDIREIARRSPSVPPKAAVPLAAVARKSVAPSKRDAEESGERPIQPRSEARRASLAPPPPRPDPTPVTSASKAPPPPIPKLRRLPADLTTLETVELPLEEIDYDAAYPPRERHDEVDLASIGIRRSIVPAPLARVANDVRQSLAPAGRAEAKRELVRMKRGIFLGTAMLLYRVANFLESKA